MADIKILTLQDIQNRRVTIKGVRKYEMCKVKRVRDGATQLIRVSNFDPTIHTRLDTGEALLEQDEATRRLQAAEARKQEAVAAAAKAVSKYTKAELAIMSFDALKELSEWKALSASRRSKAVTKEQAITLILDHR